MKLFRKPSPALLVATELENAQRELLTAQTGLEYAQSIVAYNQKRVERLLATKIETRPKALASGT